MQHRFAASAPPLTPPLEENVATLVAIGFDRSDALQALAVEAFNSTQVKLVAPSCSQLFL
jgi:hypothetical protein